MEKDDQVTHLIQEIRNLINRFSVEYDNLNYIDYYGALMDIIMDLKLEQKYNTPIEWSDDGEYRQLEGEDDEYEEGYDEEEYQDPEGDEWKED